MAVISLAMSYFEAIKFKDLQLAMGQLTTIIPLARGKSQLPERSCVAGADALPKTNNKF